ncbi:MAG: PadR family transcriptional regulator [Actinobacteria bacterium]|nr:PadR family transcriptional regulator [Actinomycetota bacterium]MSW40793.1 PadR family transcriptional regulator [Actinomycetota bacterium]
MHGYELRKRLSGALGAFHSLSYGSLYPCLKSLEARGEIAALGAADSVAPALAGKRARIVYELTAEGKERFATMLADSGPDTWDDEAFGIRFAFFGRADADVRRHILEGRRSRLEERIATLRGSLVRTRERLDTYTLELQRHGLESVEREVRWIDDLLAGENGSPGGSEMSRTGSGSGRSTTRAIDSTGAEATRRSSDR